MARNIKLIDEELAEFVEAYVEGDFMVGQGQTPSPVFVGFAIEATDVNGFARKLMGKSIYRGLSVPPSETTAKDQQQFALKFLAGNSTNPMLRTKRLAKRPLESWSLDPDIAVGFGFSGVARGELSCVVSRVVSASDVVVMNLDDPVFVNEINERLKHGLLAHREREVVLCSPRQEVSYSNGDVEVATFRFSQDEIDKFLDIAGNLSFDVETVDFGRLDFMGARGSDKRAFVRAMAKKRKLWMGSVRAHLPRAMLKRRPSKRG